jgi:S-(hydroxymethyl)glutathione dehydrogenase/alcohol dehydrogenase
MMDGTYRIRKGTHGIGKMVGVGSFSQYNVVNQQSVLPIDEDIPFEVAAVTGCGVITGVGAAINTAKVKPGSSVAVVGIGGVGFNVVQGSALSNASKIIAIDILDNKLEFAKQFGATHVINASREDPVERVMDLTEGIGADYAFEVLGKPETALTTFNVIRRGGTAVMVGVAGPDEKLVVPHLQLPIMEKNILGCYYGSANVTVDLKTLLDLYKNGRLKVQELITARYNLDEINQGFEDLESGKNARGVIIF